jgi:glycolate oxidase FAD binding subunit
VAEGVRLGQEVAAREGLGLGIVSEAGSGIIRYYLFSDTDSPEQFEQGVSEAIKRLRAFAQEAEGSLVVLEAPPGIKSKVDVWGSVGNALPLMRGLKEQFDPDRVLNPGRFVGGI